MDPISPSAAAALSPSPVAGATSPVSYPVTGVYHTDIESALARLSAVRKGYMKDNFIHRLIPDDALSNFQYKLPIFNRGSLLPLQVGTFIRAIFFDQIVRAFLSANPSGRCQIVNLGCGWDTQWLRLHEEKLAPFLFFDIDFPEILTSKLSIFGHDIELKCRSTGSKHTYVPISGDLNFFVEDIAPQLQNEGFDPALPTLLLTEVVLIYLRKEPTLKILDWFSTILRSSPHATTGDEAKELFGVSIRTGNSYFVTLDPSSFSDPFGMMMIKNLESSSIYLVNELLLSGREVFENELNKLNWTVLNSFTMRDAYNRYLPECEKKRITALEWVDELEEWNLLSSHYYFSIFELEKIKN